VPTFSCVRLLSWPTPPDLRGYANGNSIRRESQRVVDLETGRPGLIATNRTEVLSTFGAIPKLDARAINGNVNPFVLRATASRARRQRLRQCGALRLLTLDEVVSTLALRRIVVDL
jgi:hypothetical protein